MTASRCLSINLGSGPGLAIPASPVLRIAAREDVVITRAVKRLTAA